MQRPAVLASLCVAVSVTGILAFSPVNPQPADVRALMGAGLGLGALALGVPPWRDQRQPEWVRNLGLFGWIPALALVIAGVLLLLIERLRG
jgi:hypothetical protein